MAASHQGYNVFLCHAGENKAFVRQLVDRLETDGLKKDQIFYDEISLQPGDELDSIIKVIESPSLKLFVFVVSKYCFQSNKTWIRAEWEAALENNKQILPIWLDDNNDSFKAFGNLVREFSYKLRKIIAQRVNPQEISTSLPGLSEKICSLMFGDQPARQRPPPSTNVGLLYARQNFMPGEARSIIPKYNQNC
ncbi:NAD(+) hydrolase PdTIR-like [Branchiostoma lanceolatum]|uniref:NAD(+) hydrolase PdTIR-like n=1 Tax=Branchiostoma lanceolatum TaxID=7740 RepID=UPI0034571D11